MNNALTYVTSIPSVPKAELNINNEVNLFGLNSTFAMTALETFPNIKDAPEEKEIPKEDEGSWWSNLLIGAGATIGLAALGVLAIVTAPATVPALLVGAVAGACFGGALFAGVTTAETAYSDKKSGHITPTDQFVKKLAQNTVKGMSVGTRVGMALGGFYDAFKSLAGVAATIADGGGVGAFLNNLGKSLFSGGSGSLALAGGGSMGGGLIAVGELGEVIVGTIEVTLEGAIAIAAIKSASQSGNSSSGNNKKKMLGENGTRVDSKTTWKNGKTERIDVENPNPGKRPGQVHYHESNNKKWYYDTVNNKFYNEKTGELAPSRIQNLLKNKEFMKGIEKALKILGE